MIEHVENLWTAIDRYLTSKINAAISLSTSTALYASASVSEVPAFHIVENNAVVFNWVFLFQLLGAIYITLQIVHIIYKFYKWLRSF
jgi:hypothetical protein